MEKLQYHDSKYITETILSSRLAIHSQLADTYAHVQAASLHGHT